MAVAGSSLRDFCAEADELLDAMMDGVDRLEADASRQEARAPRLHTLFRHSHSLKGLAGMSGLVHLSSVAHQLEDVLDTLRMGKEGWTADVIEWLREACASLRHEVKRLASGQPPGRQTLRPLHLSAEQVRGAPAGASAAPAGGAALDPALKAVLSQYEESRLEFHLRRQTPMGKIRARWSLDRMESGLHELLGRLEPIGEVIASIPERTTAEGAEFVLVFAGDLDRARVACGERIQIDPLGRQVRAAAAAAPAPPPEEDLGHTLRVDVERLDPVISRAGELALEADRLERTLKRVLDQRGGAAALTPAWRSCQALAASLGSFRNGLLNLRMIPVRRLASRLDRTVRDLARRTGKQTEFRCVGADTELDKRIADTLLAALLHLVRNAVDHGIETAEERRAAGKPETGTVTLEAYPQGRNVTLRLSDDGRGLDLERLRSSAQRLGMDPVRLPEDLSDLIFEPGFSTASEVTETSGRGVGMDEVRQRVASLKGTLRMHSIRGQGMSFELVVPATLAIVPAFMVRSGDAMLALPLTEVLESRLVSGAELRHLEKNQVISYGAGMLPVFRLADLLGLGGGSGSRNPRQPVVVARHPQGEIGLAVDSLVGQREVMVRPLPRRLSGHPALHGAAELEGDQVALMVDLSALFGPEVGA